MAQKKTSAVTTTTYCSTVDPTDLVMTLLGSRPVFDQRKLDGSKFSKIGLIFVIIHTGIDIYIYHGSAKTIATLRKFYTSVMFGMLYIRRFVNLTWPIAMVLGDIYQFPATDILSEKLQKLDAYFTDNQVDLSHLHKRQRRFSLIVILSVLCGMIINSMSSYYYASALKTFSFHHVYLPIVYHSNFILITLKVCRYLDGIQMRLDLFKVLLSGVQLKPSHQFNGHLHIYSRYRKTYNY